MTRQSDKGTALQESVANVIATPLRSVVLATAAAGISAVVLLLSILEVSAIHGRYRDQVAAGRFVLIAQAPTTDGLDAARCDALRSLPGVRSAGAVLKQTSVYPVSAPLRPYTLVTVTPGWQQVWFPADADTANRGIAAGGEAAAELGLVDHSVVQVAGTGSRAQSPAHRDSLRLLEINRVLPPALRNPETGRLLIETAPPQGATSACLVDPDPSASRSVEAALVGWFGPDEPASIVPYLDQPPTSKTPESELQTRPTRWVWLAGSITLIVINLAIWYGRREEFALYRLLGARRTTIAAMLTGEALLTVAIPAFLGASLVMATGVSKMRAVLQADAGVPSLGPVIAADAASFAIALLMLPVLGAVVVCRRAMIDILKGF